jgi:hypothetical protein
MKELNSLYYAIIDSDDKYYTAKEISPYLDLKIIFNRYTYEFNNSDIKEIKKKTTLYLRDCEEKDWKGSNETYKYYNSTVKRSG